VDRHLLLLVDLLEPLRSSVAEDALAPGDLLPGDEEAPEPEGEICESEERPPSLPEPPSASKRKDRGGREAEELRPLENGVFVGDEAEERLVESCEQDRDRSDEGQYEERLRKPGRDTPGIRRLLAQTHSEGPQRSPHLGLSDAAHPVHRLAARVEAPVARIKYVRASCWRCYDSRMRPGARREGAARAWKQR